MHAPASVAEGRRTRRTKPSTTLPQSAPHHVRKAGLVRALGHGGGRILFRHSARTHHATGLWMQAEMPDRYERMACPRYPHAMATTSTSPAWHGRCRDTLWRFGSLRSVLWLGRIACRMQTGLCARACVRACVRACARREWRGRRATMPQVAGRQSLPPCHCGGEPSKSSSVSSCSSSSISSSPPSS